MKFPHTITIFNQSTLTVGGEVIEPYFRKTVIKGVLFVRDENTSRNKFGLANADRVSVYIPKSSVDKTNKVLLAGTAYEGASEAEQSVSYSFNKGDYVCFGDVGNDGVNINALKNSDGNIYEITGLASYLFGGLPNYVLGAK